MPSPSRPAARLLARPSHLLALIGTLLFGCAELTVEQTEAEPSQEAAWELEHDATSSSGERTDPQTGQSQLGTEAAGTPGESAFAAEFARLLRERVASSAAELAPDAAVRPIVDSVVSESQAAVDRSVEVARTLLGDDEPAAPLAEAPAVALRCDEDSGLCRPEADPDASPSGR